MSRRLLFLTPLVLLPVYWFWLAARVVVPWLTEQRRTPEGFVIAFSPKEMVAVASAVTLVAMALTYLLVFSAYAAVRRNRASP